MIVKAPIARAVIARAFFAEAPISYTAAACRMPLPAARCRAAAPGRGGATARDVRALAGLLPFVRPYRGRIAAAALFLVLAAVSTLVFPVALKSLIDQGFIAADPGARVMALREHFFALFAVGVALGVFSAARFYMVSWLGERITADLRNAVYAHVVRQSPQFFETTQTGEVLSRLTTDTTLVQTVVGSSLSMGLRNTVMGIGAMAMLIVTNPVVMTQVLAILVLVVLPSLYFGRRVRGLSRASQDRIADSSAIAAEVLNAVPVVQSYLQEGREADRFAASTERAFGTAVRRSRMRSFLVAFVISATFGALLWGLYQGTQAVVRGDISAGHLGQTVVYVIILVSSVAVLSEVYGDLLRAAGATERLMELLQMESPIVTPAAPQPLATPAAGASVRFDDVTFRYPSRPQHPTLAHFNLAVAPGETVALVGPSGAGKSTVLQLILRFYDVESGAVTVDGERVDRVALDALRGRIGIVPQDSVIFSTDAMENIRYGRPEASDDEVDRSGARRLRARLHQRAARGLPDLPRRARRSPLGRPAPAHLDRARDAEERAAAAARRGDERARRRGRADGAGRARVGDARPHDDRHRAPPLDRAARRPHRRPRGRRDRRDRHPRRADRGRRAVCAPGGAAVRSLNGTDRAASCRAARLP